MRAEPLGENVHHQEDNTSASFIETTVRRIPNNLLQKLRTSNRIEASDFRKTLRLFAQVIHECSPSPGRQKLRKMSSDIVVKFPSLKDTLEGGLILENGFSSVFRGLETRLYDLNRSQTPKGKKSVPKKIIVPKRKRDDYGCLNYLPDTTDKLLAIQEETRVVLKKKYENNIKYCVDIENDMIETYALQRYTILETNSITDVLKEFPYLEEQQYLKKHIQKLTGSEVEKFIEKAPVNMEKFYMIVDKRSKSNTLIGLLEDITTHFNENINFVIKRVEVRSFITLMHSLT